jgi:peroxiredoxin
MKRILILIVGVAFILAGCSSDTKDSGKQDNSKSQTQIKVKELLSKSEALDEEGKTEDALAVVDEAIKLVGENRETLGYKGDYLMKLGKYKEALAVALKRDEVAKRKSPWNCIGIAEAYLKLGNTVEALKYLKIAIEERNFNNLNHLLGEDYTGLSKEEAFLSLLEEVKGNIGIGRNVADFTLKLIDGRDFKLSSQRGKVVLIDFWATWCPPCVKEMPVLKKLYAELKDKDFSIVGISLDTNEDKLKSYVKDQALDWDICFTGKGWYDDTAKLYNVAQIPSTWIIDRFGKLRYFDVHGEELATIVKELLNEPIE